MRRKRSERLSPFHRIHIVKTSLHFLLCSNGKCDYLNRLKMWQTARLKGCLLRKAFLPRHTSGSYIFIDFRLEKLRKQPHFKKDSAGMEDGEGRLRKGISET